MLRNLLVGFAFAGWSTAVAAKPVVGEVQIDPAFLAANNAGDTAFVLGASVVALLAIVPGLALLIGGRDHTNGTLATTGRMVALMAIAALLWAVVGYTLAFGAVDNGVLGLGNAWMLIELSNVRAGTAIPESAFVLFHMVFAMFAVALLACTGVGRARLSWLLVFGALWGLVVFAPITHWLWGGGWLASRFGVADFAGGLVVHAAAGISALVVALLLGKNEARNAAAPHETSLVTVSGTALVWIGSLALIGGRTLAATDDAAMAILNAQLSAAASVLGWLLIERIRTGRLSATGWSAGALAGLIIAFPASGYVSPGGAIVMGLVAALLGYASVGLVKRHLGLEGGLNIFALNGVVGVSGSILAAVFAAPSLGGVGYAPGTGMGSQLLAQTIGALAVVFWAAVGTTIIALMVSVIFPIRADERGAKAAP